MKFYSSLTKISLPTALVSVLTIVIVDFAAELRAHVLLNLAATSRLHQELIDLSLALDKLENQSNDPSGKNSKVAPLLTVIPSHEAETLKQSIIEIREQIKNLEGATLNLERKSSRFNPSALLSLQR